MTFMLIHAVMLRPGERVLEHVRRLLPRRRCQLSQHVRLHHCQRALRSSPLYFSLSAMPVVLSSEHKTLNTHSNQITLDVTRVCNI